MPEGFLDLLWFVDEIEDEGVILERMGAIQAREGLDGLNAGEPLIDIHGVQQRLIEAGLVLFGD